MIFLGIDPGKKGALACVQIEKPGRNAIFPFDGKSEHDILSYFSSLYANHNYVDLFGVIEEAQIRGHDGKKQIASFFQNYGFLRCCLIVSRASWQTIHAAVWPKEFGLAAKSDNPLPRRKKGDPPYTAEEEKARSQYKRAESKKRKEANFACAKRLFPEMKGITIETADALLLAEYARRKYGGTK